MLNDDEDDDYLLSSFRSIFNNHDSDYIKRLEDEDDTEVPNVEPSSSTKTNFGELLTEHIKVRLFHRLFSSFHTI